MTLVELLVAMAILSIILTGLVTMFVSAIETTHQGYYGKRELWECPSLTWKCLQEIWNEHVHLQIVEKN